MPPQPPLQWPFLARLPEGSEYAPARSQIAPGPVWTRLPRVLWISTESEQVESVPGRNPATAVMVDTLPSHLARTALAPLRITTLVFGASATIGILLSILGLFGVLSDVARYRRREWAIRTALGAQPWRILVQMLQEGGRLACAGAVAGTLGALTLSRLLARIMPGNPSPGLLAWLVAPAILSGIVLIAGLLPALRAMAANPLSIVRDE